jgi:DNA-binding NarL/FixJ family response regulator
MAGSTTEPKLTRRDEQLLKLVREGLSNSEIAARLGLRPQTVKNRVCELYARTGARNRVELVLFGIRQGLK